MLPGRDKSEYGVVNTQHLISDLLSFPFYLWNERELPVPGGCYVNKGCKFFRVLRIEKCKSANFVSGKLLL